MADPLSVDASALAIVTAAIQSTKSLCATVRHYQDRDKTLRRLHDELDSLINVLDSLQQAVDTETSIFALLEKPVKRCSQICHEFEEAMKKFSGKSRTGLRDWAKMEFMRDNINGFMQTLTDYKSVIMIGLGIITMQHSKLNHKILDEYSEMVKDTTYSLEMHLQRIEERLSCIATGSATNLDTDVDLQDERVATRQCLRICEDAMSYMETVLNRQSSSLRGATPHTAGVMRSLFDAELVTRQTLSENRDKLAATVSHLREQRDSLLLTEGPEHDRQRSRLKENINISTVADSGYHTASSGTKLAVISSSLETTLEPVDNDHDRHDRYSHAGSLAGYENETTEAFAEWVLVTIRQQLRDIEPSDILAMLPDILQEFAIKLGHEGKSPGHRKLMYVAHKRAAYRILDMVYFQDFYTNEESRSRAVAKLMDMHILDSDSIHNQSASDDDDEEKPGSDVDWQERINMWDDQAAIDPPPEEELFHTATNDPYEDYQQILNTAEASLWLVSALKRGLQLRGVDPISACRVRREVLNTLNEPSRHGLVNLSTQKISPLRDPPTYETWFEVYWDPISFLEEECLGVDHPDLTTVVTVTGDGEILQALPCKEYMMQTWPFTASDVLSLLVALIAHPQGPHEIPLVGNSRIRACLENGILRVNIRATEFQTAEVAEMLAWLGCALQSKRELAFCQIQPHITRMPGLETSDMENDTARHFNLRFIESLLQKAEATDCWKGLFTYMTIAQGFPIPSRPTETPGLEIPLDIAASIIGAEMVIPFKSRLLIKSFSAMLHPVKVNVDDGIILWHLLENSDKSRISYADPRVGNGSHDGVQKLRYNDIGRARHIIGWCEKVECVTGTSDAKYDIGPSGLDAPQRGWVFEKFQISGGQYLTPTFVFSRGKRIRALNISREGKDVISRLEWLDNKNVILFDTLYRRGWLVDGPSAMLHLARASLKIDNDRYEKNKYASITLQEPMIQEGDGRDHSHRAICLDILTDDDNLDLELRKKRGIRGQAEATNDMYTFEDRVKEILAILEQMFDHQGDVAEDGVGFRIASSPWKHLQGFDFVDVASRSDPFDAKGLELKEDGEGWAGFTRAVNAITLFGYDYGELLQPVLSENEEDSCNRCLWSSPVPRNRDILAVSMAQLEYLHRGKPKWRSTEPGARHIGQNRLWERPASAFKHCSCDPGRLIQARVQTFAKPSWLSNMKKKPEPDSGTVSRVGAVLLGIHSNALQKPMPGPKNISQPPGNSLASAGSSPATASTSHSSQLLSATSMQQPSSMTSLGATSRSRSPSTHSTLERRNCSSENGQAVSNSHGPYLVPGDPLSRKRRAIDDAPRPDAEFPSRSRPFPIMQRSFQSYVSEAHTPPGSAARYGGSTLASATANNQAGHLAESYLQTDEEEEEENEEEW